jgi:hypothetical protein
MPIFMNKINFVAYEILTVVFMKSCISWDITLWSLGSRWRRHVDFQPTRAGGGGYYPRWKFSAKLSTELSPLIVVLVSTRSWQRSLLWSVEESLVQNAGVICRTVEQQAGQWGLKPRGLSFGVNHPMDEPETYVSHWLLWRRHQGSLCAGPHRHGLTKQLHV